MKKIILSNDERIKQLEIENELLKKNFISEIQNLTVIKSLLKLRNELLVEENKALRKENAHLRIVNR